MVLVDWQGFEVDYLFYESNENKLDFAHVDETEQFGVLSNPKKQPKSLLLIRHYFLTYV
jgi:hypothetical protein